MFGTTIRKLREEKGLLLRQVAAELDIDTALLSKIERGNRGLKKEQVFKLAKIFDCPTKNLIVLWLSDKIMELVKDEYYALDTLNLTIDRLKIENRKKTE